MKTVIGMASINWRHSAVAYQVTWITVAVGYVQYVLNLIVNPPGNISVAAGNYLYLLPLFMGIFVTASNFPKLMNLGGKRMDFFISSVVTFAPVAAAVSLISLVSHLTVDRLLLSTGHFGGILDLYEVFGFINHGPVVAFFQMTAFLLLIAVTAHTLTLVQGRRSGWAVDAALIIIVGVFTPIAPLRAVLIGFFNLIIFNNNALMQIAACVVLSAAVYGVSLIPIKNRQF